LTHSDRRQCRVMAKFEPQSCEQRVDQLQEGNQALKKAETHRIAFLARFSG
jgi:hypothetical protein